MPITSFLRHIFGIGDNPSALHRYVPEVLAAVGNLSAAVIPGAAYEDSPRNYLWFRVS